MKTNTRDNNTSCWNGKRGNKLERSTYLDEVYKVKTKKRLLQFEKENVMQGYSEKRKYV